MPQDSDRVDSASATRRHVGRQHRHRSDGVDHYIEFFKRVQANAAPGVVPPLASTDGVHFDRQPAPEERAALVAYLRTLK